MPGKISSTKWTIALVLLLAAGFRGKAFASATATITVAGSEQQISGSWDQGNITIAFNGFIETIHYAQFSSPASVASALAATFSRDYIKYGLCANASGATITFHLKGSATFSPLQVTGPTTSFQMSPSSWPSQISIADIGTVSLVVNGVTAATTTYGEGATTTSIAAGLAAGVTSNSPVTVKSVNDSIDLEAKQAGSATNYSYTVQNTSYDATDFSYPSFPASTISGSLDGGADANGAGKTVYSYSTSYQPNGNVSGGTDSVMRTWSFTYDNLNRLALATANQPNNPYTNYCWSYDSFGNRTNQEGSNTAFQSGSGGQAACSPQSNASLATEWANYNSSNNRMTGTPQAPGGVGYDAAGDITNDGLNQYLYDAEGRVCAVLSAPISGIAIMTGYLYNAEGQRVAKGTITTMSCDSSSNGFTAMNDYILDSAGNQLTEMAMSENGSMAWQHTNVFANGQLLATYDNDGLHFHLTDPLGTRRSQTDYAGVLEQTCSSLPFGDQLACSGGIQFPTEHHFTGKERDSESGNDYFGARYYGSSMGRFMSPDPGWLFAADPGNPQTWNQYAYVLNNPLSNVDPMGYDCVYLNNAGNGAESVDTNSNSGECGNNGGYWVDGTFTSGTVYSNSNDVYLHGTENGQLTDSYYNSVTANGSNNSPSTVLSTPNIFPFNPQKSIPAQFLSSLVSSLNRSGQSDALVNCIISHESGGNTTAATPSPNTAKGLMQVNNGGAADVARLDSIGVRHGGTSGFGGANGGQIASQLFDPAVNIAAGTALLNAKINLYNGGDVEAGVAAYGTGDAYAKARMACAAGH